MTNFEKFKSMDIDELAEFFMDEICAMIHDCPTGSVSCHNCVKAWLEEEVNN